MCQWSAHLWGKTEGVPDLLVNECVLCAIVFAAGVIYPGVLPVE